MEKLPLICPYCYAGSPRLHAPIVTTAENFSVIYQEPANYPIIICFHCGNVAYFKGFSLLVPVPTQTLDYLKMIYPQIAIDIEAVKNMVTSFLSQRLVRLNQRNNVDLPTDVYHAFPIPGSKRTIRLWNRPKQLSNKS